MNGTDVVDNDLFSNGFPLAVNALNLVIVFASGVLAAAAGVGGGAIFTPLYIGLFGLVYEAVPLSKAAVCGVAIAFLSLTMMTPIPTSTNHPYRFAYDVIMIMEPATLLGTVFGVLASRTFPYWLITVMMTLLLSFSAYKTFKKAITLYTKEIASEGKTGLLADNKSRNQYGSNDGNYSVNRRAVWSDDINSPGLLSRCLAGVGLCFTVVLLTAMLADDDIMKNYTVTSCGTMSYWMLVFSNVVVCGLVTYWNATYLVNNAVTLSKNCAIKWNHDNALKYSALCLVAGFLSALCGIGGSTIKGPILLEMGLHPTLAKSTSQLMLVSTVTSSAFQFFVSGSIPPQYGATFFVLGICSGLLGKFLIDRYVERNGRQSTIVFLLGCYIVVATISMMIIGIVIVLGQVTPRVNYYELGFRNVCDATPPDVSALKWLTTFSFASNL